MNAPPVFRPVRRRRAAHAETPRRSKARFGNSLRSWRLGERFASIPLKQALGLIPLLAAPLVVGAFSLLAWFVLGGGITRGPERIEYVIPLGTAERIAAGEKVAVFPPDATFVVGDVLALKNLDRADHRLGPFWIPAATTLTIPLERASDLNYLCSIHPSGAVTLKVRPQNSVLGVLTPTLLLGVPMGFVLLVAIRVASRLDG